MTNSDEDSRPRGHAPGVQPPIGKRRVAVAVHEVCPYLRSEAGSWRSAYAAREHRCGAVQPAAQVTIAKQRSICLVGAHATCATFVAAGSRAAELVPSSRTEDSAGLWPSTRSMPLLLEPTRGLLPTSFSSASTRAGGQALLVGLMVLAFLVLVIARTTAPPGAISTAPAASEGAAAVVPPPAATPSPSPTAAIAPSLSPSASPSAGSSAKPSPTPLPSRARTYTVLANDTLSGIAAKFKTSVRAIAAANNITNTRLIHAGQVLVIP